MQKWVYYDEDTGTAFEAYRVDAREGEHVHTFVFVRAERVLEIARDAYDFVAGSPIARDVAVETFLIQAVATCVARLGLAEDIGLRALGEWLPHLGRYGNALDHYRATYRYAMEAR